MAQSVGMWMSVMIQIGALALSTHFVTTQRGLSSACVLQGTTQLALAARILTNARATPLVALTRFALTCLEVTTALVLRVIMRKNRHVWTQMNVSIHHATPWHCAGTLLATFHATAPWVSLEMVHGAKM